MRRRLLLWCGLAALAPTLVLAQPASRRRIGLLLSEATGDHAGRLDALRVGLRERGYAEGREFDFLIRSAEGQYARLPALARELVAVKPDVIVAFGAKATLAAQRATSAIPVVVPLIGDPVRLGVTRTLAQPASNVTGNSVLSPETSVKQVELMKELVPGIGRVGHVFNPENPTRTTRAALRAACTRLKLAYREREIRSRDEIEAALAALAGERVDAISLSGDTLFRVNAGLIARFATRRRWPTCGASEFADAGCLVGYGAVEAEMYRRSAYFIDRILKGASPRDLPVQQATRFEFVLNERTARALGILLPAAIRMRADRVIE